MNQVNVKMVVFDCPFGDVVPDLLVTVNFTELGINTTFPANAQYGTVSIVLGLHTDILDVIHNTWAIPLVPDMHLFGGVIRIIREQFKRPGLASLGVFSSVCASVRVFCLTSLLSDVATPDEDVLRMCHPIFVARPFPANSS